MAIEDPNDNHENDDYNDDDNENLFVCIFARYFGLKKPVETAVGSYGRT